MVGESQVLLFPLFAISFPWGESIDRALRNMVQVSSGKQLPQFWMRFQWVIHQ